MPRTIVGSISVTIQSGPERRVALTAHCYGEEQLIAPDNRTRVGESGNAFLPSNILTLQAVPMPRKVLAIGDARRGRSAELRPMAGGDQIRGGIFRGNSLGSGRSKPYEGCEEPDTDHLADSVWHGRRRAGR